MVFPLMTKNEEYKGFWFLPDNPENHVAGILYFEAYKEIRLELIGGFNELIDDISQMFSPKPVDIIHGITSENKKVSLFVCNRSGSSRTLLSSFSLINYKCQYFIKGKHLSSITEEIFSQIKVNLNSLYRWCPSGMIQHSMRFENENQFVETNFSISKTHYWEKTVTIDDFKITLFGEGKFSSSTDSRDYNLTQNTFLNITNLGLKGSFLELLNKVELFKQFLSLASLSSVNLLEITLFDDDDYAELKNGGKALIPISLYTIENEKNEKEPYLHQFLFSMKDIGDIFPDVISRWYGVKKEIAPIRNHLISSLKYKKYFTSLDFLIIVQALEGYHRRFINDDPNLRLRPRLVDLLNKFNNIQKISNNPIDIKQVIESRNYYSHFFDKTDSVLEGKELYFLTKKLRTILVCCVLSLIGFVNELINELLNKNDRI